ncbi:EAL domain-containing protein [Luteibacter flocculans]|uniref:EAL domain-containing protein n=1 Tax=Luteibacter flocculans TaxID=2780091 RepID=A0ABY4T5A9_9GAMM|nr:EAL domain-containing protein [Luteibacter flocculans]URL60092.1 EAL domain-containing protein [Luteibacter flocculans]
MNRPPPPATVTARDAPYRSARLIRVVGGLLALMFGLGMAFVIVSDHERRVQVAKSQDQAVADGGQRIITSLLWDIQRAMVDLAEESAPLAVNYSDDELLDISHDLDRVAHHYGELANLVLMDPDGKALTPGVDDPTLATWVASSPIGRGALRIGPLQPWHGGWVVPLAVPVVNGRWLVARLKQSRLQAIADDLGKSRHGVAAITDRFGTILARSGDGRSVIGEPVTTLFEPGSNREERQISHIDGVDRVVAVAPPSDYPFWVGVGVPTADVLAPWYRFTFYSVLLYLVYWAGMIFLYRRLHASESAQVAYLAEITATSDRLADAEARFRLAFDRNPLPSWVFDTGTLAFLEVNEAAVRNYGYSREEFLAMRITDIRPPADQGALRETIEALRQGGDGEPDRLWMHRRKDGSTLDVRIHAADIDLSGRTARLVLAEDVTERIRFERALTYRATHDVTTGLPNTEALVDYLDHGLGKDAWYELFYVHLRGMDRVSDTFGLEVGRNVLRKVAARFGELAAAYGMVAHRPGDRFLLAIDDPGRRAAAMAALLAAVNEPVMLDDTSHTLDPQLGVASHPTDGAKAHQVIANAALAAHVRTDVEPDGPKVFEPAMARHSVERLTLASRMRQAIEGGELDMHFQPIVDARTGAVCKLEALARWPQADGSFIPPDVFIPLCEETGLIVPLGQWVIETAARARVALVSHGFELPIAINISALQFQRADVAAQLQATARAYGLAPDALQVELTESSLMDRQHAVPTLKKLGIEGIHVSLDDFGTGFSNMAYLRDLPIDALKIDRSFIVDIDADERAASICRSMIALARTLGMTVVAEGVERERQYAWLRENGCDQLQGYYFAVPMPMAVLAAHLRDRAAPFQTAPTV